MPEERKVEISGSNFHKRRKIKGVSDEQVSLVPENQREKLRIEKLIEFHEGKQKQKNINCPDCHLTRQTCICDKLLELRIKDERSFEDGQRRISFLVLMHAREKFRSSNTGKLLKALFDSEILLDGVPEDERKLDDVLKNHDGDCVVLFPSTNAIDVNHFEFRSPQNDNSSLLVIVLDGTWRQARRLNHRIPLKFPRIKIKPETLSLFLCRTQTQFDRVCTAEAVALLLEDLGMPGRAKCIFSGLHILNEAFNLQTFHMKERPPERMKKTPRPDPKE